MSEQVDAFGSAVIAPVVTPADPQHAIVPQFRQGTESNISGKFLEDAILGEFMARSIPIFDAERYRFHDWVSPRTLVLNAPYISIYGSRSRSEFVYQDITLDVAVRIECRWQETGGSVDEKLPYLFLNARDAMPEREVLLVLDGGGARPKSIEWLRKQCVGVKNKKIRVTTLIEARKYIKQLISRVPR